MSGKAPDLTGRCFNRLTVVERAENKGLNAAWRCVCACGKTKVIVAYSLLSGATQSCGCLAKDRKAETKRIRGERPYSKDPLYWTWRNMIARCHHPRRPNYCDYGARGIVVCDEWRTDFRRFAADMGARPDGMTLDRENNDGPYSPDNCRWATDLTQANNRRGNHPITHDGRTMTIPQWAREVGIKRGALYWRIVLRNWPIDRALSEPVTTTAQRYARLAHQNSRP